MAAPRHSERKLQVTGRVRGVLRGPDGQIKAERTGSNIVVNNGLDRLADRFVSDSSNVPAAIAVGTSSTAENASQTDLVGTELGREALTSSTQTGAEVEFETTFGAGSGTGTIEEAGLFDNAASESGVLLARFLTGTFDKGASDSLTLTWTLTLSQGS